VGAVATPLTFVTAVAVANDPNVAVAALDGVVKVTVAPLTTFPPISVTVACSAVANDVLVTVLCGVPADAVILAGAPAVFVRLKLAAAATPATLAVTA
jgi:hypothetical protein